MAPVPKHPYTQATLIEAIRAVQEKTLSLNRASQVFGIPYATLGDKVRGRRPINAQPRTLLQAAEEERLLSWLKETARQGFGRTKSDIKDTVKAILDARGAVTNSPDNRPSKQWVADFFKRHPDLSERTPLALGKSGLW
ncbi:hypothetical protein RRG08_023111 [Elysia crispata]|uniref:HTH CENPB-type domain-containing protein n=1 Tax=Elysia crispata TaxID=231223 RepID=A0AAE1ASP0_9GAST|nr:hypothetical protein RRG08_023111 [Elysia crispata]